MEEPTARAGSDPLGWLTPAVRIALLACAAVHLYGANAYFENAAALDAYARSWRASHLHLTPHSTTILIERVTFGIAAALLLWFFCRAYSNLRVLATPEQRGRAVWSAARWAIPVSCLWLLSLLPQALGRGLLDNATTFGQLRAANALECGGEALTGVAALLAVVVVTCIGMSQSVQAGLIADRERAFWTAPERVLPQTR
ncbi:MAG: hypothetical protein QOJ22_1093 [Thermoleophilaceae bacterium]|nr:hypothetical protein [Thermoleophilaceae bacterium]